MEWKNPQLSTTTKKKQNQTTNNKIKGKRNFSKHRQNVLKNPNFPNSLIIKVT